MNLTRKLWFDCGQAKSPILVDPSHGMRSGLLRLLCCLAIGRAGADSRSLDGQSRVSTCRHGPELNLPYHKVTRTVRRSGAAKHHPSATHSWSVQSILADRSMHSFSRLREVSNDWRAFVGPMQDDCFGRPCRGGKCTDDPSFGGFGDRYVVSVGVGGTWAGFDTHGRALIHKTR
jgi:hypothetical protein